MPTKMKRFADSIPGSLQKGMAARKGHVSVRRLILVPDFMSAPLCVANVRCQH